MLERNSNIPLYKQLKKKIKRDINNNIYQDGESIPTEKELEQKYSVSRHTVREAVSELVSENLVERIQGKGTLVTRKKEYHNNDKTVGIIVPYIDDGLISKIVTGVENIVNKYNYKLLFGITDDSKEIQSRYIKHFTDGNVEGIIIFPAGTEAVDENIEKLSKQDCPLVLIDRLLDNVAANYVVVNNRGGGYKAVDHLISQGHRKIGFVTSSGWEISSIKERFQGYKRALKEYNLPVKDDYVFTFEPETLDSEKTFKEVENYLTAVDSPTAIFCVNDLVAIDIINVCQKLNIDIPGELSIVGFDDIDILKRLNISLTTIAQPKEEIGKRAALMLINLILGKETQDNLILPTKLVIRETTAAVGNDLIF